MLVCRPVLSLAAQGITALILQRKVSRQSWRAAAQYWMAYTSLVDLGCIAILAQQARRESTPLRTAMGFEERPPRPLRSALADVALVVPATFASQLLSRPLSDGDPYPPQIRVAHLHGWTKAYSITIWPVVWGISEQATYLGYALPRTRGPDRAAPGSNAHSDRLGTSAHGNTRSPRASLRRNASDDDAARFGGVHRRIHDSRASTRAVGCGSLAFGYLGRPVGWIVAVARLNRPSTPPNVTFGPGQTGTP